MARSSIIKVKNNTNATITAGSVVYISGRDNNADQPTIGLAHNGDGNRMPAVGVVREDAAPGDSDVVVKLSGPSSGFDTSDISINTAVYVGQNGGVVFGTEPHETDDTLLTQQIGVVLTQEDYPNGQIQLFPLEIRKKIRHPELLEVTEDQHHVQDHADRHRPTGVDPFLHAAQHRVGGGDTLDHGSLGNLAGDHHTIYPLADGTRGFSGAVEGVYPTDRDHLATKRYVDTHSPWRLSVIDKDILVPPGSPSEGDRYIIGASGGTALGAWTSQELNIAEFLEGSWVFIEPENGSTIWVKDEKTIYSFDGSEWLSAINKSQADITGLQITVNEHYRQHSGAFKAVTDVVDGYVTQSAINIVQNNVDSLSRTSEEHYTQHSEAIQTVIQGLDGYVTAVASGLASEQTVNEHYRQHSTAFDSIRKDLDGYGQTIQEHYKQHSTAFDSIRKELDGYATDYTVQEHYVQHSQILQSILKDLDGYVTLQHLALEYTPIINEDMTTNPSPPAYLNYNATYDDINDWVILCSSSADSAGIMYWNNVAIDESGFDVQVEFATTGGLRQSFYIKMWDDEGVRSFYSNGNCVGYKVNINGSSVGPSNSLSLYWNDSLLDSMSPLTEYGIDFSDGVPHNIRIRYVDNRIVIDLDDNLGVLDYLDVDRTPPGEYFTIYAYRATATEGNRWKVTNVLVNGLDWQTVVTLDKNVYMTENLTVGGNIINDDLTESFQVIRKELDGYNATISEHYTQHSDALDTIRKALDGYGEGAADVYKVGTPADNQVAVWTGDGTIEGRSYFNMYGENNWPRLQISTTNSSGYSAFQAVGNGNVFLDLFAYSNSEYGDIAGIDKAGMVKVSGQNSPTSMVVGLESNDPLYFITNNAVRMTISSGGRVGINTGTSTLTEKFNVNGNASIYGNISVGGNIINDDLSETFAVIRQALDGYGTGDGNVIQSGSVSQYQVAFWDSSNYIKGSSSFLFNGTSSLSRLDISHGNGAWIKTTSTSNTSVLGLAGLQANAASGRTLNMFAYGQGYTGTLGSFNLAGSCAIAANSQSDRFIVGIDYSTKPFYLINGNKTTMTLYNGKVGIGTGTDTGLLSSTLTVNGSAYVGGNITATGSISVGGNIINDDLSETFAVIRQALDGYITTTGNISIEGNISIGGNIINDDLSETFAVIRQALDGYGGGGGISEQTFQENKSYWDESIDIIRKDLDGYNQTIGEHYIQHSDAIQTVIKSLDGYSSDVGLAQTVQEHYDQHGEAIQTVIKSLDGYSSDTGLSQTVEEHYTQHSEAINTIIGSLDGYSAGDITGSGVDKQVTYWTGTKTISGSSGLYFDYDTDSLGIGTNNPNETLTVNGVVSLAEVDEPNTEVGFGKIYIHSSNGRAYLKKSDGENIDLTAFDIDGGSFTDTFESTRNFDAGEW